MKLFNLNVKSYYSILNSTLSIDDIINYALNHNQEYVSLIDDNVMFGVAEFYKKAIQNNLKPIVGIEIEIENNKFVLIAKNFKGYQEIVKVSSYINEEMNFDIQTLLKLQNVFFIRTSGDFECENQNFYLLKNNHVKNIICNEVRYENINDSKTLKILNTIRDAKKISLNDLENLSNEKHFLSEEELNSYDELAKKNFINMVSQIEFEFPKFDKNIFDFSKTFLKMDEKIVIKRLCLDFLNENKLNNKKYLDRLDYELNVIFEKNFSDYFLIVSDFVKYAKKNDITIGPGRGSASGSLVSYCLEITEVDPIKYNLLFERFLNKDRVTMPDIDIDVMDEKRNDLLNFVFNKYGKNKTSYIITFSTIKIKSAIRDVGRIFDIDKKIIDLISKKISVDNREDLIELIENDQFFSSINYDYPYLFEYVLKILNNPRQISIHAAGIVISKDDIWNRVPTTKGPNGEKIVQYSMEYLEYFGLIKIDILALRNLTIINKIIKLVEMRYSIKLNDINLNEKKVFSIFQKAQTTGIFQFESHGMRNLLRKIEPNNIEDLSLTSALFRPGASSFIDELVKNKKDKTKIKYFNKEIKEILETTYGVIVYQEQIIKLTKTIAMFDSVSSDNFRRAISKKEIKEVNKLKESFINSSIVNNYKKEDAIEIFETMLQFAKYGFNHSHSIAYALISYKMAYLKAFYSLEALCIFLSYNQFNNSEIKAYLKETKEHKINIKNPSIKNSFNSFSLEGNNIILPLSSIVSVGKETIVKINAIKEELKNFNDPVLIIVALKSKSISKVVIENLIKAGAFDEIEKRRNYLLQNLDKILSIPFVSKNEFNNIKLNLDEQIIESKDDYVKWEMDLLPIVITKSRIDSLINKNVNLEINNIVKKTSSNKKEFLIVNCLIENDINQEVFVFDLNTIKTILEKQHNNEFYLSEWNDKFVIKNIR